MALGLSSLACGTGTGDGDETEGADGTGTSAPTTSADSAGTASGTADGTGDGTADGSDTSTPAGCEPSGELLFPLEVGASWVYESFVGGDCQDMPWTVTVVGTVAPVLASFAMARDPGSPEPGNDLASGVVEADRRVLFLGLDGAEWGRIQPLVVIFEDLHWIDAATEQFVQAMAEASEESRTLLLVNFRPEYRADWTSRPFYRQIPLAPLGPEADKAMDAAFVRLTAGEKPSEEVLDVDGRAMTVRRQAAGVARFTFDELCKQPLGAADYLTLARHYSTVLVDHVPKMSMDERNWAARFVTLIDALYECRTKLVMSADAEPDDIYVSGEGAFEFQRTASRLHEMRSAEYLASEREHAAD